MVRGSVHDREYVRLEDAGASEKLRLSFRSSRVLLKARGMVREADTSPLRTLVGSHRSRTESHGSARAAGALSTTRCHAVRVLVRKAVPGSERGFVPSLRLRKNTRWWQPDQEWEGGCFPTAIFVQQGKLTTPDTLLWPGRSRGSPIRRLAVTRPGESLNFLERPARTALDRSLSLLHGTLTCTHLTSRTEQFPTLFGDWDSPPHRSAV